MTKRAAIYFGMAIVLAALSLFVGLAVAFLAFFLTALVWVVTLGWSPELSADSFLLVWMYSGSAYFGYLLCVAWKLRGKFK
jgi:hypothetical protein